MKTVVKEMATNNFFKELTETAIRRHKKN